MSDLRVKVKYYDIEIEYSIPLTERDYLEVGKTTQASIVDFIKQTTECVEQLIITGRKSLEN
jgi:hypothetical protein